MEEPPNGRREESRSRAETLIWAFGVLAVGIAALAGAYVALRDDDGSAASKTTDTTAVTTAAGPLRPGICTVKGIPDAGFVNAELTGRSGTVDRQRVVAVVALLPDDRWYFQSVSQTGRTWNIDASTKFEVSTPEDGRSAPFSFSAVALTKDLRIPPTDRGFRAIPDGFEPVGREVTRTRGQLLRSTYRNPDC
ncbi:MAG: hypothetical protein JW940_21700 [Polyangiaceae bacterium]|nr:hypothetical protein [Polyangiaceae bacterium]